MLAEPRGILTLLTGDGVPALDGCSASLRSRTPTLESRCTKAASRTIRCCWPPNESERHVRVVLVEDNDVFRETLELLFGMRDEIEVVGSVATATSVGLCARAAPTSC